jgi:hypothetical protein
MFLDSTFSLLKASSYFHSFHIIFKITLCTYLLSIRPFLIFFVLSSLCTLSPLCSFCNWALFIYLCIFTHFMRLFLSFISLLTKSGKVFVTNDVTENQWTVKGKCQEKSLNESKISDVTVNLTCSTEQRAAWETFSLSSIHFYSALRFIPFHIKAQGSSIYWTRLINALQPCFFKYHFRTILPSLCICLQIGIYPSELAGEHLLFICQLPLHVCYMLCLPIVNLIILIFFYAAFSIKILTIWDVECKLLYLAVCATFPNTLFVYREESLATRPTPELKEHPLSGWPRLRNYPLHIETVYT